MVCGIQRADERARHCQGGSAGSRREERTWQAYNTSLKLTTALFLALPASLSPLFVRMRAEQACLQLDGVVVEDLHAHDLRLGLLHQQPLVLVPRRRQRLLLHVLHASATAQKPVNAIPYFEPASE